MIDKENQEFPYPFEAPSSDSGGLPFDAAFIPFVVVVISIVIIVFLSQVRREPTQVTIDNNKSDIHPSKGIAPLFTPEVQYWDFKILPWSEQHGLDPNLVATVMQIESCGYSSALSPAGAMGLFQVMPYHFSNEDDPYKPNINARRGLTYLKQALVAADGDIRLALAGYNGGITAAGRSESAWAAETRRYVYWGTAIYEDAKEWRKHSTRLEEWLNAGGASLCSAAAKNIGLAK